LAPYFGAAKAAKYSIACTASALPATFFKAALMLAAVAVMTAIWALPNPLEPGESPTQLAVLRVFPS
jgi:hypothetical protein